MSLMGKLGGRGVPRPTLWLHLTSCPCDLDTLLLLLLSPHLQGSEGAGLRGGLL